MNGCVFNESHNVTPLHAAAPFWLSPALVTILALPRPSATCTLLRLQHDPGFIDCSHDGLFADAADPAAAPAPPDIIAEQPIARRYL